MKLILILLCFSSSISAQKITVNQVYNYCIKIGIKHPKIVTAQSVLETGWYKCSSCSYDYNNIFGFFYKGSFISFDNWKESVDYYKRWQDKLYKDDIDYYEFLKCLYKSNTGRCISYAANMDTYLNNLRSVLSSIKSKLCQRQ